MPPPLAEGPAASPGTAEALPVGGMDPGAAAADERAPETSAHDGAPRRRRRRRRRKPMAAGSGDAADGTAAPSEASPPAAPQADGGDGTAEGEAGSEGAPVERPILRLRNRRRRHRRPRVAAPSPESGGAPDNAAAIQEAPGDAAAGDNSATSGEEVPGPAPGARPPRSRNRRRRRASPAGAEAGDAGEHRPRDAGTPARTGAPSGPRNRPGERRPQGERGDAARPNAPRDGAPREGRRDGRPRSDRPDRGRDRPPGRGRDGPPRRVERALYSFDSVVDRGFEDIEEEAGTRRVHWTIVKRTTADQGSRKPVSALYVVQRDGVDSEFPNLGAARNTVNKTIVHPEKLTRSKAEYAAEKGEKK
jgi:translation initiation factor IF-2